MIASTLNCNDFKKSDFVLVSANYDKTSSFGKGADKGPRAIIECLDQQIEFFNRRTGMSPAKTKKIAHLDLGNLNKLSPEKMVSKIKSVYSDVLKAGTFPILLGGEHSVSNGPFQTFASRENPKKITILQIDAHFDLRNNDSDYNNRPFGKYAHSAVMRRAVELGFKTVHVGIRAYSKEEYEFAKARRLKFFEWGLGPVPPVGKIVNAIPTERVYLTIDADGIDPAHMPATGTPVQGGLEWRYFAELLEAVFKKRTVIGADLVEVAPKPNDSLTEYGAAQICYDMISFVCARRSKLVEV